MENKSIILSCSNCGAELIELVFVKQIEYNASYYANCPACGDKSYPENVVGKVVPIEINFDLLEIIEKSPNKYLLFLKKKG